MSDGWDLGAVSSAWIAIGLFQAITNEDDARRK